MVRPPRRRRPLASPTDNDRISAVEGRAAELVLQFAGPIPGARSHVFQGAAHVVNLERPREFSRRVLEFLDGPSQDRSGDYRR